MTEQDDVGAAAAVMPLTTTVSTRTHSSVLTHGTEPRARARRAPGQLAASPCLSTSSEYPVAGADACARRALCTVRRAGLTSRPLSSQPVVARVADLEDSSQQLPCTLCTGHRTHNTHLPRLRLHPMSRTYARTQEHGGGPRIPCFGAAIAFPCVCTRSKSPSWHPRSRCLSVVRPGSRMRPREVAYQTAVVFSGPYGTGSASARHPEMEGGRPGCEIAEGAHLATFSQHRSWVRIGASAMWAEFEREQTAAGGELPVLMERYRVSMAARQLHSGDGPSIANESGVTHLVRAWHRMGDGGVRSRCLRMVRM